MGRGCFYAVLFCIYSGSITEKGTIVDPCFLFNFITRSCQCTCFFIIIILVRSTMVGRPLATYHSPTHTAARTSLTPQSQHWLSHQLRAAG